MTTGTGTRIKERERAWAGFVIIPAEWFGIHAVSQVSLGLQGKALAHTRTLGDERVGEDIENDKGRPPRNREVSERPLSALAAPTFLPTFSRQWGIRYMFSLRL